VWKERKCYKGTERFTGLSFLPIYIRKAVIAFIYESSRLFRVYAEDMDLECVALKAITLHLTFSYRSHT